MSAIAIIDSGGANIASVKFALDRLDQEGVLTTDVAQIRAASHVILPGVGAAGDAMIRLKRHELDLLIPRLSQPVLGICLGMQLLFEASDEDDTPCLGILPGRVRRFPVKATLPVPHMGWNRVAIQKPSRLLDGIPDGAHFYFLHSYRADVANCTIGRSDYGGAFSAVIEHQNFLGAQFHPERSGDHGARILQNFLRI